MKGHKKEGRKIRSQQIAKMSKRKTGKDDSTPHENEELSERQSNGKRDKKKKKARREEVEAAKPQTEKKTSKRKRGDEEDEEDGTSGYNDRGPKDSIKQGAVSSKEKDSTKKKKKKSKKAKKAPSSEDEAEQLSESKSKKEKKASKKKKKEKKKSKKEKKAKKSKGTTAEEKASNGDSAEEKEKASNGDSAKEKEVETGASSATTTSSNGGASDQGGAGWNNWEASSFGDDARKNKFLRLMGAKKTGDTPSQPPQKKGLFGSLRASTAAPEPSAIDSSTEQKITHDLASQFQDALQRRNCRGGIGLDSGSKKSDRSAEPQPHPYTGGKASTKLHIDDYPKSIKFDD